MSDFSLRVSFGKSDSALWDAAHEGNPRVGVWGSWGRHRLITQARLPIDDSPSVAVPIGPFTLPLPVDYRGDEHVSFVIMASSQFSGDKGLDAEQRGHVLRDIQIGMVAVPLRDILPFLAPNTRGVVHRVAVHQQHTFETPENDPDYEHATFKGTLALLFETGPAFKLPVYPAAAAAARKGLLFGSEEARAAEAKMRDLLRDTYLAQFGPDSKRWKAVDNDDGVARFHITEWQSDVGWLPPVAYLQHDMEKSRERVPGSDWPRYAKNYAHTHQDALIMDRSLRATWAASGRSVDASIAAMNTQLTQSDSDPSLSADFLDALRNIADFGREHATCMHYTRDFYFRNKTVHSSETNRKRLDLRSTASTTRETEEGEEGEEEEDTEETGSENWSTTPITGMANACDCDECGMTAHEVLEKVTVVGALADPSDSALLHAVARVTRLMMPLTVQGLVTTAFVDTNGKKLAAGQVKTLPMRGTPEFTKQHAGGHFFGMWMSRATLAAMLTSAGHNVAKDLPRLAPHPTAWERRIPIMILEGTGFTDLFILPAAEFAPLILADAAQAARVVNDERSRHEQFHVLREHAPTLFAQLKLYQPAQYIDKQDPMQTLTPFYRYMTQMQCNGLYQMNPRYGHLKPVNLKERTHSVYVDDLLRAAFHPKPAVGLFAVYSSLSDETWQKEVVPVMACLQNQLPLSIVGRSATVAEREHVLLLQHGHVMNSGAVSALAKIPMDKMGDALDRHARGLERFASQAPKLVPGTGAAVFARTFTGDLLPPFQSTSAASAAATPILNHVSNPVPVIGFLEPWVLANEATNAKITTELNSMKASGKLEHVAWVRNRKLPQADDQLTLRASLHV